MSPRDCGSPTTRPDAASMRPSWPGCFRSRESGRKLVISVLDLPETEARPKRQSLYGRIPWSWWLPACRLPGKSLQVGAVCWLLAGCERSAEFELALNCWLELDLSRFSASRGVDTLEQAGLVSVASRP